MKIQVQKVKSSNIESVGYDAATKDLLVVFKGNNEYLYSNVPAEHFEKMTDPTVSPGSYLAKSIKGHFGYAKVKDVAIDELPKNDETIAQKQTIKTMSLKGLEFKAKELVDNLKESGFVIITDHNINKADLDLFYSKWKNFFNSDEKNLYLNTRNYSGYFPLESEKAKYSNIPDLKEFYQYYEGLSPDPTMGLTKHIRNGLDTLGHFLLLQIYKGLPEEIRDTTSEPIPNMALGSNATMLRIINYPKMDNIPDGAVRSAAHEDINLITLLPMSTTEGLQVLARNGEWIDVGGDPNAIIINIGDMLQEITKGYLKSTTHRVVNINMDKARLSAPLFIHPRPEVRLSEKYTAGEYLAERLYQIKAK
jgi:isopenicillin N synthase-like dioxygenase